MLLAEEATAPGSPCLVEASGDPRAAAGGLAMAVLKCQLRPVRVGDYGGSITGADLQRIRAVFPDGVCHPDRPGAGRLRVDAEWIDYSDPSL